MTNLTVTGGFAAYSGAALARVEVEVGRGFGRVFRERLAKADTVELAVSADAVGAGAGTGGDWGGDGRGGDDPRGRRTVALARLPEDPAGLRVALARMAWEEASRREREINELEDPERWDGLA